MNAEADVTVVGSGPNGLAAAVTMARAGLSVLVLERADTIGGGARTAELTLPGFHHDVCSAVHPMAMASPFFRQFGLADRIELVVPDVSYGHPLDDGSAGIAYRDLGRTADGLGPDGAAWTRLFAPLVDQIDGVVDFTTNQLLRMPRSPLTAVAFALRALEQGTPLWNRRFAQDSAPAMLTGVMAHSMARMPQLASAGAGLVLAAHAHARGWPIPIGGSQAIVDALAEDLRGHGGIIRTGVDVTSLGELDSRAVLLDVTPRALVAMAGERLPAPYRRALERYRYGNGAAKVDFALSGPVPWTNTALAEAPTVHLGGNRAQIAEAEAQTSRGEHSANPYVLVSQPSVVDPGRAPDGKQVLWAYSHVPSGSTRDPVEDVTRQIERFAPGFRDVVLATASMSASELESYNPNYVGGDIGAGAISIRQLLRRPVLSTNPWRTPLAGVYLASAATPPGPAVHGLAGWHAARHALAEVFGLRASPSLAPGS
ncbi:MAG: NAD(P)/FAD-dependent oxidoreductase [Microbacteriaceae bacterium]|nr:NAD(P)/FAD-dependent oxidoreductase [Microbacteriaceae bacterium]